MSSIREAVLVSGFLKGKEFEAACTVRAVKVSLMCLDTWEYVSANITQAPADLPDGTYTVSFEGRSMTVKKLAGKWESSVL
jgi:hypothetical protein